MKQTISLDDFLSEESKEQFLCTIETTEDKEKVKITPWISEEEGCHCHSSIEVKKEHIESVVLTDKIHFCCGKRHKVVEVLFKETASVKVADLFREKIKTASKERPYQHKQSGPRTGLQPCGSGQYNPDTQCCCEDGYGNVFVRTRNNNESDLCCCDPGSCIPDGAYRPYQSRR